jgi:hypothetical protein
MRELLAFQLCTEHVYYIILVLSARFVRTSLSSTRPELPDCPVLIFQRPANNSVYSRQFDGLIHIQLNVAAYSGDKCSNQFRLNVSISMNGVVVPPEYLQKLTYHVNDSNGSMCTYTMSWILRPCEDLDDGTHLIEANFADNRQCWADSPARVHFTVANALLRIFEVSSIVPEFVAHVAAPQLSIAFRIYGARSVGLASAHAEVRCDGQLCDHTSLISGPTRYVISCADCCTPAAGPDTVIRISLRIFVEGVGDDSQCEDAVDVRNYAAGSGILAFTPALPLRFSSFRCAGGTQALPVTAWTGRRACLLERVCWAHGSFIYYEDPWTGPPPESPLSATAYFDKGLTTLHPVERKCAAQSPSTRGDAGWAPEVCRAPIPVRTVWAGSESPGSPEMVHALDVMTIGFNPGHFLLDSILPVDIALDLFGLGPDRDSDAAATGGRVRLVREHDCSAFADIFQHMHGAAQEPKVRRRASPRRSHSD